MLLIKNGHIKTMAGQEFACGQILIGDDGKILEVGENLETSPNAQIIDAGGRLVTPGCVDAHCHVGVHNEAIGWEGRDYNENVDPITPQLRAIDGINPMDSGLSAALSGGVTTACTGPGSANVVGGTFAAIKLHGIRVDDMIVKAPLAMKCAFGENPKKVYGQAKKAPVTRMAVAALLRELLFKTRRYVQDQEAGKNPSFDMKLEAMAPVIRGEIPLKAHVHRADDILTAIRIAKEFGVKLTLDHCTDGALIAGELADEGYPALIGPTFGCKSKPELVNKSFKTPKILADAGVKVSIVTDSPVVPLEYLAMYAGLAVKEGLSEEYAWKAITIHPAEAVGIADRVGSLEPGKDGDVVIWSDDPLHVLGASAYRTILEGRVVYPSEN